MDLVLYLIKLYFHIWVIPHVITTIQYWQRIQTVVLLVIVYYATAERAEQGTCIIIRAQKDTARVKGVGQSVMNLLSSLVHHMATQLYGSDDLKIEGGDCALLKHTLSVKVERFAFRKTTKRARRGEAMKEQGKSCETRPPDQKDDGCCRTAAANS